MTQDEAFHEIVRQALRIEKQFDIPAEVTAAQVSLESNRLQKADGNNCFGMKAVGRHKGRQLWRTREWFATIEAARAWAAKKPGREIIGPTGARLKYPDGIERAEYLVRDWFAKFDTLDEAFDDYGWLITNAGVYRAAWQAYQQDGDWRKLLEGIAKKYAMAAWPRYVRGALACLAEMQTVLDEMRKEQAR